MNPKEIPRPLQAQLAHLKVAQRLRLPLPTMAGVLSGKFITLGITEICLVDVDNATSKVLALR
ncbi:MAG: hypothetical protein BZY75_02360 [SAR202 cluster bacterium Io17-Chloro-G7]|nr:MAG: hypothetical protein BZY75_02360 [SAR202 cluster bacterium Io17-Chloro-G7]